MEPAITPITATITRHGLFESSSYRSGSRTLLKHSSGWDRLLRTLPVPLFTYLDDHLIAVPAPTPPHHRLEMATPLLPSVVMEISAQLAESGGARHAHPFSLLYLPRPLELPRPFTHSPGKLARNSYLPTGPMYFVFGRLSPYSLHGHHGIVWLLLVISPLLTNAVSRVRACLSIWLERFRGSQKEDERGPLSF